MKTDVISRVCQALSAADLSIAATILATGYPFVPITNPGRSYTARQMTAVFVRDGFVDRYSGDRLVFPGTLRLLSVLMPTEFPFHERWKTTDCHSAYWQLFPTIDHVIPIARGGADDKPNWVTTSMLKNAAKANWMLDDLGWALKPPGSIDEWDGLMGWFVEYTAQHPDVLANGYLKRWRAAALSAWR